MKLIKYLCTVKEITHLDLSGNKFTDRSFYIFCKRLQHINVITLDISDNNIGYNGLKRLAISCEVYRKVKQIYALNL